MSTSDSSSDSFESVDSSGSENVGLPGLDSLPAATRRRPRAVSVSSSSSSSSSSVVISPSRAWRDRVVDLSSDDSDDSDAKARKKRQEDEKEAQKRKRQADADALRKHLEQEKLEKAKEELKRKLAEEAEEAEKREKAERRRAEDEAKERRTEEERRLAMQQKAQEEVTEESSEDLPVELKREDTKKLEEYAMSDEEKMREEIREAEDDRKRRDTEKHEQEAERRKREEELKKHEDDQRSAEEKIIALYKLYEPKRSPLPLLKQYVGRENDLLDVLQRRYAKRTPPPAELDSVSPPRTPRHLPPVSPRISDSEIDRLLSKPIDVVLQEYPLFKENFDNIPPGKQGTLRNTWGLAGKATLEPVLLQCAKIGCFKDAVKQALPVSGTSTPEPMSSVAMSPTPSTPAKNASSFKPVTGDEVHGMGGVEVPSPVNGKHDTTSEGTGADVVKPVPVKKAGGVFVVLKHNGHEEQQGVELPDDADISDLISHCSQTWGSALGGLPTGELQATDKSGNVLSNRSDLSSVEKDQQPFIVRQRPAVPSPVVSLAIPPPHQNVRQAIVENEVPRAQIQVVPVLEPGCTVQALHVTLAPSLNGKNGILVALKPKDAIVEFPHPWCKRVLSRDQIQFVSPPPVKKQPKKKKAAADGYSIPLGAWEVADSPVKEHCTKPMNRHPSPGRRVTMRSRSETLQSRSVGTLATTPTRKAPQPTPKSTGKILGRSSSPSVSSRYRSLSSTPVRRSSSLTPAKPFDSSYSKEYKFSSSPVLKPLSKGTLAGRGRTMQEERPCPDCGKPLDSLKYCMITRLPHQVGPSDTPRKLSRNEMEVAASRLSTKYEPSTSTPSPTPSPGKRKKKPTKERRKSRKSISSMALSDSDEAITPVKKSANKRELAPASDMKNAPSVVQVSGLTETFRHPLNGQYAQCTTTVYQHKQHPCILYFKDGRWRLNDDDQTDGWLYSHPEITGQWINDLSAHDFSGVAGMAYPLVTAAKDLNYEHEDRIRSLQHIYKSVSRRGMANKMDVNHALSSENVQHLLWIMNDGTTVNWGEWLRQRIDMGPKAVTWDDLERHCRECLAASEVAMPSPSVLPPPQLNGTPAPPIINPMRYIGGQSNAALPPTPERANSNGNAQNMPTTPLTAATAVTEQDAIAQRSFSPTASSASVDSDALSPLSSSEDQAVTPSFLPELMGFYTQHNPGKLPSEISKVAKRFLNSPSKLYGRLLVRYPAAVPDLVWLAALKTQEEQRKAKEELAKKEAEIQLLRSLMVLESEETAAFSSLKDDEQSSFSEIQTSLMSGKADVEAETRKKEEEKRRMEEEEEKKQQEAKRKREEEARKKKEEEEKKQREEEERKKKEEEEERKKKEEEERKKKEEEERKKKEEEENAPDLNAELRSRKKGKKAKGEDDSGCCLIA
eukprot:TRINITY_DN6705_c0_g1_i1.p1 TRINITY_DN6705_c0_g1~~TRINITY_DN6705_c0_g1_i1.p1  ORF type:complete len:1405 (+),score=349.38 TRINITY_DN6705_c0_g1_i1:59-4273(+)